MTASPDFWTQLIQPSELTRPFWEGCRNHRLLLPHCKPCGQCFFPPAVLCPHCFTADWEWAESAGRGWLHSYSIVHRAPLRELPVPFVFAAVDLDEGCCLFSNILDWAPETLTIGMPLRVRFHEVMPEIVLPCFEAAPA